MNNERQQIRTYFRAMAVEINAIGDTPERPRFFSTTKERMPNEDLPPGSVMYLSPMDANFAEQDGSQLVTPLISVSVLTNFEAQDFDSLESALDTSYALCKEILAKMILDRREGNCLLNTFDLSDARIIDDDPFWDGWIGCTITFPLRIDEYFEITPEAWTIS